jgi:hypothetical protein
VGAAGIEHRTEQAEDDMRFRFHILDYKILYNMLVMLGPEESAESLEPLFLTA